MKQLIYTTFTPRNEDYEELIWEWIISLKYLAKYEGDIIVFNYGMPPRLIEQLQDFGAKVVDLPYRDQYNISNYRNIDVIPHLRKFLIEKYDDYVMAHYDADIWFQKSLDEMFETAAETKGVLFATEYARSCRYRGPIGGEENNFAIQESLGGHIFGGWQAGKSLPYLNKLNEMKTLFESDWDITEWGTDQSMLNSIYDAENDKAHGLDYACTYYFCDIKDGIVYRDENLVTAVHLTGFGRMGNDGQSEIEAFRFKNLHQDLWQCHHP